MPFAPGAANFGKFIFSSDCAVPWFVYVETFIPAFIKLLITQNVPFWDDLARERASSLAYGGERVSGVTEHTRRLRASADDRYRSEKYAQRGLRTLLTITEPLEHIGFLWMLYASADQFYIDWQTLIEQRANCQPGSDLGHLSMSIPQAAVVLRPDGQDFGFTSIDHNSGEWGVSGFSATLPPGQYFIVASVSSERVTTEIGPCYLGLKLTDPLGTTVIPSQVDTIPLMPGTDFLTSYSLYVPPFTTTDVRWAMFGPTSATGAALTKGRLFISRTGIF